ncbi:hypothetical protein HPB52_023966 [Rhipicephalus sanguineus]|uniref:Uncharacterized protein n=1 Tax=Rhipicephalus sanguineus TaxID=34632 RepID=A0A9D4QB83_RHISA|nr:hypothetical protein HPB52_023966 [Rhipicephalus sanguineus]
MGMLGSVAAGKSDKTVKEESLPPPIVETVEAFKKYVTEQKEVREEISRIPSQAIAKVQEETAALRQLLSTVENGIQRNAVAVERLKRETSERRKDELSSGKITGVLGKPQSGTVGSVTTAVTLGPTPFSSTKSDAALAMATALARVGQPTLTGTDSFSSSANQTFQLQKPPPGNKRGKK